MQADFCRCVANNDNLKKKCFAPDALKMVTRRLPEPMQDSDLQHLSSVGVTVTASRVAIKI